MSFLDLVLVTVACETVWKNSSLYTCDLCAFLCVYFEKGIKLRHKVRILGNAGTSREAIRQSLPQHWMSRPFPSFLTNCLTNKGL